MVDNVFCWSINDINNADYMRALNNYHNNIKTIQSVHIPNCVCGLDSYQLYNQPSTYTVYSAKQHLTGLPLDKCK